MPNELGGVEPQQEKLFLPLLVRVTLRDGTVLRYTDLDLDIGPHDIGHGPETFLAAAGIRRGPLTAGIDLRIDETWVRVLNGPLTLGGVEMPVAHWVKVRKFNGALVEIYTYDEQTAAAAPHSVWYVQGAEVKGNEVELTLESFVARLDVEVPRMIFQVECNHQLGDRFCGVALDLYEVTSTVVAGTTTSVEYGALTPSTPPAPAAVYTDDWFAKGEIEFVSGNLLGLRETLAAHAGSVVVPIIPFPEAPDAGSQIRLWPGCLKRIIDCRDKFGSNRVAAPTDWFKRFLGFPFMEEMERTLGFGGAARANSGGGS